jgi:hypothetical protein
MTRHVVLVTIGVFYVAGACCFVQWQGAQFRRTLQESRGAILAKQEAARPRTQPTIVAVHPDAVVLEPKLPTPVPEPASKPVETAALKETETAPETKATVPRKKNRPVPRPAPAPLPLPKEPEIKLPPIMIAGLVDLPASEETKIGAVLHDLILANYGDDPRSAFPALVLEAVKPMLELRARKDVEITITVLDSDEVNAFSHLGGFIYLTRGLFSIAATPEEYRFVAGHELAHVDLKHSQIEVAEAMRAGAEPGIGTLQYLYYQIAKGYSREHEFAADDWVVERMLRLDNSKRECLAFLRKFVNLSREREFPNGIERPKTSLRDLVQDLDHAYKARPAAFERLSRLTDIVNERAAKLAPTR